MDNFGKNKLVLDKRIKKVSKVPDVSKVSKVIHERYVDILITRWEMRKVIIN